MMRWKEVGRELPGGHAAQPHSVYGGMADAAKAELLSSMAAVPAKGERPVEIVLDGLWERAIDLSRAETYDVAFDLPPDDAEWLPANVPQNYGLEPDLEFYYGPLWYRRTIRRPHDVRWLDLRFEAVDYLADVVLDGQHLGRHEGYFAPFHFDLSKVLQEAQEAELLVRVQDPLEDCDDEEALFLQRKKWVKGVLNYHDSRPGGAPGGPRGGISVPGWNFRLGQSLPTGGIVGPVTLSATGAVRLDGLFVTPLDLDGALHLCLLLHNRTQEEMEARVVLELAGPDGCVECSQVTLRLQPGANRADLESCVENPALWYDAALEEIGEPNLYQLQVTVFDQEGVSDGEMTAFGFRQVEFPEEPQWHYVLNGEPIYIRAANYIPVQHWARLDRDFYQRDFQLLREANLHSVGVHAHVQSPACYRAADEMGISVFQDFTLQWAYASGTEENPGFVDKSQRMAAEMAYRLWNHPCVTYYVAHNEPLHVLARMTEEGLALQTGTSEETQGPKIDVGNYWLDVAVRETLQSVDPTRYVHLGSGVGTDCHLYSGTIVGGSVYDIREMVHRPFVSEYGSFIVDRTAANHADSWAKPWPPTGERLVAMTQRGTVASEVLQLAGDVGRYPNLEAFAYACERKQAFVAKYQTEFFRIKRNQPFTGYRWHFFVNHWNWSGGGLLDMDRVPTMAYEALKDASRDWLAATSLPDTVFIPGERVFPIYLINDGRWAWQAEVDWRLERLAACEVIHPEPHELLPEAATLHGSYVLPLLGASDQVASGQVCCDVPALSSLQAGEVTAKLDSPGAYRLVMTWMGSEGREENDYTILIAPEGWEAEYGLSVVTL